MKPKVLSLLFVALLFGATSNAQVRYLDEVFTDVQVDTTVVYAQNYSFLTNFATLQPLVCDIYTPVGDTATDRPVILLSHNGSFLPESVTTSLLGLCFGGRRDSAIVEMCQRFAKRGYVAVSFDYRLGWAATASDQTTRTKTIIQAVYRAMQDAKSLVRYFKNDYANNSNSYGIDTARFVIGGSNSGAYVALAAGAFNDTSELNQIKFVDIHGSFVKQDTLGDFDGFGGVQNNDNYPGISSRFQCVLSLGGCIGDTSWVQAGEPPVIAFHGVNEVGSPFNTGVVTTTTGQPVIEVSGPGDYMPLVEALGNNSALSPNNFPDGPPNFDGNAPTTSIEGSYPFYGQGFEPWGWYNEACYNSSASMQGLNPGASKAKSNTYIDTIMGYASPRLYKILIDPSYQGPVGIKEVSANAFVGVYPNPVRNELFISVKNQSPITSVRIFDITGRLAKSVTSMSSFNTAVNVNELSKGSYLLNVTLSDGSVATKRVVIE